MNCFNCESGELVEKRGPVNGSVRGEEYTVFVRALVCPKCGDVSLTEEQGAKYSAAIADAYRGAHGLLTAGEIKSSRKRLGLTQEQFADHVGVGVASIRRWEAGAIQDESSDRLLRLQTDLNVARTNVRKIEFLLHSFPCATSQKPTIGHWESAPLTKRVEDEIEIEYVAAEAEYLQQFGYAHHA